MEKQKFIIDEYLKIFNNPTIKFISNNTDIQSTRVFRLLKGHEMRISEYQKFQQAISQQRGEKDKRYKYIDIFKNSVTKLSEESIDTFINELIKKVQIQSLVHN